jgi:aspartate/methionine/tyrosine aminotransferase
VTSRSPSTPWPAPTTCSSACCAPEPDAHRAADVPFVRLVEAKRRLQAQGVEVLDFGVGEPREETPAFIRRALAEAVEAEPVSAYPLAEGLPELRAAAAGWVGRRFGVVLDPDREIVPTLGAKEAIFHLAQVVDGAVAVPAPGYPVAERGALFAGREVVEVPLRAEHGWLPDLDAVPWERIGLLWLISPGNPTATAAPLAYLEEAAARARAHDVVLAATRPTASCGSPASLRRRRCRSPTGPASWRSTRSPSARRCRATAAASSPATRR